jgi:protein-tyrosine phosphatase
MNRVLFLCSGNYYRSRFAEVLFNWHARQQRLNWTADSRGLQLDPLNSGPISLHTISWLSARGILCDSFARQPMPAADEDFETAQHVIAVKEAEHRRLIESKFPKWRDHVEYWHVHDLDCSTAAVAIPHLEREVLSFLARLAVPVN